MTRSVPKIVRSALVVLVALLVLAPAAPAGPPRTLPTLPFAPGSVVVIADQGVIDTAPGGEPLSRDARVTRALATHGLARAMVVGPAPRAGSQRRERVWLLTSARPDFDPVDAARALQATGAVRAACPNYRFSLFATLPNDLYLPYQWYVDDGSYADIRLPLAWDIERGDTSVVIAIMDTGVDTGHPDLVGKIWHNPGEVPGDSLDNDGNGLT